MSYIFKDKNPKINTLVHIKITEINKLNVVCTLTDYNNMKGYISYSELSKKKRYNLHKIVSINKELYAQITNINNTKEFAELSIRLVNDMDIQKIGKFRKKYVNLYNLWRYIYMKLYPECNMDIKNIDNTKLYNFMENTFWLIEDKYKEEIQDEHEYNYDEIYNKLLDKSTNEQVLECITLYNKTEIKNILDEYINKKKVISKKSINQEFTVFSYNIDGLNDIKCVLNFKNFDKYNELSQKYDISIIYTTNSKYSINIKEKEQTETDIDIILKYFMDEIQNQVKLKNIYFSIVNT